MRKTPWALIALGLACASCEPELCEPVPTRLAFFSQGDCRLTRASFFRGHEWLTHLGNTDLDQRERFSDSDTLAIAEGNRRVDWPKELLVNLNASVFTYVAALEEYTERPENQRLHFLLSDRNTTSEAIRDSVAEIRRASIEAIEKWPGERARSLALIGRANHVLQDSFSSAHAVRDVNRSHCIVKVKAYIPRAAGYLTPEIEFHGAKDATLGHTTTEDSIYRAGRDCHEPTTERAVEDCLNEQAKQARLATRDYLRVIGRAIARYLLQDPLPLTAEDALQPELEDYLAKHFAECGP